MGWDDLVMCQKCFGFLISLTGSLAMLQDLEALWGRFAWIDRMRHLCERDVIGGGAHMDLHVLDERY